MCSLLEETNAISNPEKKADNKIDTMIMEISKPMQTLDLIKFLQTNPFDFCL
jgi:hypothetical protein